MTDLANVAAGTGAIPDINDNFIATSPAGMYGRRASATAGLTWGYYGGVAFDNLIADGTVSLTASDTNYIVADRSTGAVSADVSVTDWDNVSNFYRLYEVVADAASVTNYTDYRDFTGGSGGGGGSPDWTDITNIPAPIQDLAALTDPGADRLLMWDDSAGAYVHATLGTNLSFTGTTLNAAGGGGGGSPGGSDKQIQFNDAGAFGAEAGFEYDKTSNTMTVTNVTYSGLALTAASASGGAGFRLPHGAAPTSPVDGDMWTTSAGGLYVRINGVTVGPLAAGGGGGGLTNWTEGVNSSAPNASIPVVSFVATNAATNVDVAIVPKGTGNIATDIADGTTAGGNKRGIYSADLQNQRTAASQVASGLNSALLGGASNTASQSYAVVVGGLGGVAGGSGAAVVGGDTGTATGLGAVALGGEGVTATGNYSIASGRNSVADGPLSTASGQGSDTRGVRGARAHAALAMGSSGSSQTRNLVLCRQTTNATPTPLTADNGAAGSGNVLVLINNSVIAFEILVSAKTPLYGDRAAWMVTGMISRNAGAGSTVIDGTPTVTNIATIGGASAWSVSVSADTTLGALSVDVTGVAATSIQWFANVNTSELSA